MNFELSEGVDYSDSRIKLNASPLSDVFLVYDQVKNRFVVVKKLITNGSPKKWELNVGREVDCLNRLSHLIPFAQILSHGQPINDDIGKYGYYIYMDFICGGDLGDLITQLRVAKSSDWEEEDIEENVLVGWNLKQELIVAYGTARALQYMHSINRVHRDLNPENILLTHDLEPKIAGFDFARKLSRSRSMSMGVGTWMYNSPEKGIIIEGCFGENEYACYGPPSDIYSWAITMYEMITLEQPYGDVIQAENERSLLKCQVDIIGKNLRPEFPEGFNHPLKETIEKCWNKDPDGRYTAEQLCQYIQEIAQQNLDKENLEAFNMYAKKIESPRGDGEFDGNHKNIEAS